MKKKISVITAAVLAAGAFGGSTVYAADYDGRYAYTKENRPYAYFKAVDEEPGYLKLRDDFIYVNKNKMPVGGVMINAELYIFDHVKTLRDVLCYFGEETGNITVNKDYDPCSVGKKTPFKSFNVEPGERSRIIINETSPNYLMFFYTDMALEPWKLEGENPDDYPLICFDMTVGRNCAPGCYSVDYLRTILTSAGMTVPSTGIQEVYEDYKTVSYEFANCCPPMKINVGECDLGDLDNNGKINEKDADLILNVYCSDKTNIDISNYRYYAADVNADGEINEDDAEMVLEYSMLYGKSEDPEVTFEEFVIENIND